MPALMPVWALTRVADKLGDAYRHPLQQDLVSVSVSIPLIDWGVRKGKYNMARNNLNVVRIAAPSGRTECGGRGDYDGE